MPAMLRSLLFIPGHRGRFYEKLAEFKPDAVIIDLEDAVPGSEKALARSMARERLGGPLLQSFQVFVRVNDVRTPFFRNDIDGIVASGLDGIFLPKSESSDELREANMLLAQAELRAGLPIGQIRLVPIVESVQGALRAEAIVTASPRVLALSFGSEDFSLDLGVERSRDGVETRYPRAHVALVAHGFGRLAFDTPWTDIADTAGLERETIEGRQLGYTGKCAIHPSQIPIINAAFSPTDDEVRWATRVIEAYEAAITTGTGAINLDGKLIDVPMVARARRVLERAQG
jgi:citrate lyase subunit beta/citryl-CoA lyase